MTNIYIILVLIVFSFIDYWLYPIAEKAGRETLYHIAQEIFKYSLALVLWYFFNWWAAWKFLLIWWTFSCDLLYYGFCEMEIIKDHPGRGSWNSDATSGYYWAWWTPLGFYRKENKFTQNELFTQALVGLAIAFMI